MKAPGVAAPEPSTLPPMEARVISSKPHAGRSRAKHSPNAPATPSRTAGEPPHDATRQPHLQLPPTPLLDAGERERLVALVVLVCTAPDVSFPTLYAFSGTPLKAWSPGLLEAAEFAEAVRLELVRRREGSMWPAQWVARVRQEAQERLAEQLAPPATEAEGDGSPLVEEVRSVIREVRGAFDGMKETLDAILGLDAAPLDRDGRDRLVAILVAKQRGEWPAGLLQAFHRLRMEDLDADFLAEAEAALERHRNRPALVYCSLDRTRMRERSRAALQVLRGAHA